MQQPLPKSLKRFVSSTFCVHSVNISASLGIALLFLIMAFFVGCNDPGLALFLSCLIAVCQSLESAGHITSLLSLAPQYTETLSAMSMFFSQSARLATPYAVNALRDYEIHGWEYVFIMASVVNFTAGTIFVIFGSGEMVPGRRTFNCRCRTD